MSDKTTTDFSKMTGEDWSKLLREHQEHADQCD